MEFLKSRVYCTYNSNLQVGIRIQSNQLFWLSQLRTLFFQQSQCALKIPDQIVGGVSSKSLTSSTRIVDHKGETRICSVTCGTRGRGAIRISTPMMDGQDSDGFRHVIFYYLYKSRDTNTVTTPVGCWERSVVLLLLTGGAGCAVSWSVLSQSASSKVNGMMGLVDA